MASSALQLAGSLDPERDEVTCSTRPLKLLPDGRLAYQGLANHNMIALTTAITAGGNSPSTRQVAASRVSERGRRDLLRMARLEREGKSAAWLGSGLVAHGLVRVVIAGVYSLSRGKPRAPGEFALIEAMQDWDVTGRLGEITAPVLVAGVH